MIQRHAMAAKNNTSHKTGGANFAVRLLTTATPALIQKLVRPARQVIIFSRENVKIVENLSLNASNALLIRPATNAIRAITSMEMGKLAKNVSIDVFNAKVQQIAPLVSQAIFQKKPHARVVEN